MNRRKFLRAGGTIGALGLLGKTVAAHPFGAFLPQLATMDNDKVLVLIRLAGGNDGLNTLIGLDQLDNLRTVRPNLAIGATEVLPLTTTSGLHPAMTGMRGLYDEGKLSAIQAVGYPNQNRSHFRSTDIWSTGSDADVVRTTGWLGRYLGEDHPDYPLDYPNSQFDYPLAVTMGNVVSATCQGNNSNYSVAVNNPASYLYIAPGGDTPLPPGHFGREASYVRNLIGQSNSYGAVVQTAAQAGNTLSQNYTDGRLSDQLRKIALMISGGLRTKIYVATLTGFDTHAGQVVAGNTTEGTHAQLLAELSGAIAAFQEDLQLLGVADRVAGMTFSEFGRRIRSNFSEGSDHGDAGPMFAFGNCVRGGVLGESPEIDTQVDQNTGVPFQHDFRDVYGSLLVDWFGLSAGTVSSMFAHRFTKLPIFGACANPTSTEYGPESNPVGWMVGSPSPNPVRNGSFIKLYTPEGGEVLTEIYDARGVRVRKERVRLVGGREQRLELPIRHLPAGVYVWRLRSKNGIQVSRKFVK